MTSIKMSAEDLNKMADQLLREHPIHTDSRNEVTNTRLTVVTVEINKNYALIHKEGGQTFSIRYYENPISALLDIPGSGHVSPQMKY